MTWRNAYRIRDEWEWELQRLFTDGLKRLEQTMSDKADNQDAQVSLGKIRTDFLRWDSIPYRPGAGAIADTNTGRYLIERLFRGARTFILSYNGKPLCEVPTIENGKSYADRHMRGTWKP